jgi:hypothetical protein
MGKRWGLGKTIALVVILFIIFIVGTFAYFIFRTPTGKGGAGQATVVLVNPASGLSEEQAVQQFNESFVLYLLYQIKANNLHNPPLSESTPKIKFYIDQDAYSAEVVDGVIFVKKGEMSNVDIIIRTTKQEGVKMLQSSQAVVNSFSSGASDIEMVAGKATLFTKGYLKMYEELTGEKIL